MMPVVVVMTGTTLLRLTGFVVVALGVTVDVVALGPAGVGAGALSLLLLVLVLVLVLSPGLGLSMLLLLLLLLLKALASTGTRRVGRRMTPSSGSTKSGTPPYESHSLSHSRLRLLPYARARRGT
jgi:hypothetical protein